MCAGSRAANPQFTRSGATKYGRCESYAGNSQARPSYSRPSAAARSRQTLSIGLSSAGERADYQIHAHMLRHGCGYASANAGHYTRAIQDWLGHRSIQHTVRYTELAPTRLKDFGGTGAPHRRGPKKRKFFNPFARVRVCVRVCVRGAFWASYGLRQSRRSDSSL